MTENNRLKRLNIVRDFIAENFQTQRCLLDIANYSNISPYHFLRIFKQTYGETPNEFLIRLRLERAKKILITESMNVSEVCEDIGYTSLGSFSSLFLRHVGTTPTAYRRKLWSLSAEKYRFPSQAIPTCFAYHFVGKSVN